METEPLIPHARGVVVARKRNSGCGVNESVFLVDIRLPVGIVEIYDDCADPHPIWGA
jgi:hypothetical protein